MTPIAGPNRKRRRAAASAGASPASPSLLELRLAIAERAALAAFPIDKLGPPLGIIEHVLTFKTVPQFRFQARVGPWAALIVAGSCQGAAMLWQTAYPEAVFDDDLWRVIEATQPVTADRGAVERVVAFFLALVRTSIITLSREAEFTAVLTRAAERSRLQMEERIDAARGGVDGLRLIPIDEQWSAIRDPEGMRLVWERLGRPGPQPSGLAGEPVERDPAAAEGKGPNGPAAPAGAPPEGQVLPLDGGEYPGEIDPDALVECWSRSGDTIATLGLRLDIVGGERIRVRVGFVLKSADRPWSAQADALVLARWANIVDAPAGDAWCSLVSNLACAQARSGIGVRFKIELRRAAGALPPWRLAGVREYF
jgi:hypothetical protein